MLARLTNEIAMAISTLVVALALAATPATAPSPIAKPAATSNHVDDVESRAQSGGVTAGNIGTVNQVLPTLVRGPLLESFKTAFAQGAHLRIALLASGRS